MKSNIKSELTISKKYISQNVKDNIITFIFTGFMTAFITLIVFIFMDTRTDIKELSNRVDRIEIK